MKIKINPRGKYMLVKPEDSTMKENKQGLIIPANVDQEKKAQGEVISVGSEIKDVKKGDRIIFGAYAGETLKLNEDGKEVEYKLLYDDDVIAFLK